MKNTVLLILAVVMGMAFPVSGQSTKHERNYISEGNKLYKQQRFAEAEVQYRKALEENAASEVAAFNLAASLIRQSGSADPNSGNNPMAQAQGMLSQLAKSAENVRVAENAFYNLGNMAFNQEQYQQSIDMYKGALRKNPDNDKARENLRLAQIKLREQQQNQDKDQNQDQQQNQDQDKNQNQNQDQQQDQNKNQDQNKDQQQDQDQNQDQQQKDQNKKPQNDPQQQTSGMSDANAEKILKAMENEEAATRKRVEAEKKKAAAARRKQVLNPW